MGLFKREKLNGYSVSFAENNGKVFETHRNLLHEDFVRIIADSVPLLPIENLTGANHITFTREALDKYSGEAYTLDDYKQAFEDSMRESRKWELDYFGLQKEYNETKQVLGQARRDYNEAREWAQVAKMRHENNLKRLQLEMLRMTNTH